MYINGEWVDAESAKTMDILNPSTGELLGKVPLAGKGDVDKAVKAAQDALPGWSKMMQADRVRALYRFATALRNHSEELVSLEVNEHGTPLMLARGFAMASADMVEYAAQISRGLMGQVLPQSLPNTVGYLQRVPIGCVCRYHALECAIDDDDQYGGTRPCNRKIPAFLNRPASIPC